MLLKLDVELVDGLGTSGTDGDEGRDGGKGRDVDRRGGDGVDLRAEETDSTFHLVESSDVSYEGSLEGVDVGVELRGGKG